MSYVDNHPLLGYDLCIKRIYLNGLASAIKHICNEISFAEFELFVLRTFQVDYLPIHSEYDNVDNIRKAVSIRKKGFNLKSIRFAFITDIFGYCMALGIDAYVIVQKLYPYTNKLSNRILDNVYYSFIDGKKHPEIDDSLWGMYRTFSIDRIDRILVVAKMSAGKSTLINALIGNKICKSAHAACTNKISNIIVSDALKSKSILFHNNDIRIVGSDESMSNIEFDRIFTFSSKINIEHDTCFIDTPGVNNSRDNNHYIVTSEFIASKQYDTLLYVADATALMNAEEETLLCEIKKDSPKRIIFVINQLDNYEEDDDGDINTIIGDFRTFLTNIGFINPIIVPICAQAALDIQLNKKVEDWTAIFNDPYYQLPKYAEFAQKSTNECTDLLYYSGINLLRTILKN